MSEHGYPEQTAYAEPKGPTGMVSREMLRQSEETSKLHNAIGELENRLAAVILPRSEVAEKVGGNPPREVMPSAAEMIASQTDSIFGARRRIETLLASIEL